jgi:uncharacterized protein YcfJ
MNRKQIVGVVAGSLALSTAAFADQGYGRDEGYPHGDEQGFETGYDYAQVVSVDPLVRQVRVTVPQRECHTETRYVPVHTAAAGPVYGAAGGMILGGLVGAVVGHQFDSHHSHNNFGALAGGIVGTAIGHDVAEQSMARHNDYGSGEVRPVSMERCEVHEEEHVENHTEGFRVTYRYNGRTYMTRMPRDPGRQLRIRVAVSPAE